MKHASQHTTSKVLALTFLLAIALLGVFAVTAAASPNINEICSDCHTGVGAPPAVTITSAPGADPVTYSVSQTSTAWAAFDLTNNLTEVGSGTGGTGTFSAPLGHYVRVCSADGSATGTYTTAYLVTPKAPSHGKTTPSTPQVVAPGGTSPAFTFTADAGYHLSDVKVNTVSNPAAVTAGTYTFTNVQADSTIAAVFAADVVNFTITPSAGANGTISPATPQTVVSGSNMTFAITPDTGYNVATLTVDGTAVAATTSYTFTNVTKNHSIAATFAAGPQKCKATIALTGLKSGVLKFHKVVTIKGVVTPAHSGSATLTIQRKAGSKWVAAKTIARPMNATTGAYSYGYKPTKTGTYRVKTSLKATSLFGATTTAYKTFKVK